MTRVLRGAALAALIFLLVQLGALALVPTFYEQGYQTVSDPSDPANSVVYIGAILVMTALMLAAFRYDFDQVVRAVVVFTGGMLSWYVFRAVLPPVSVGIGGVTVGALPLLLSAGIAVALLVYPEWYVIDVAGVLMGAGAAGLFGISFGLLPAIVLLSLLAVYDAISVYGTEHMLDLAEGVMSLRVPVVLVIPLTLSYSLLDSDPAGEAGLGEESPEAAADGEGPRSAPDDVDAAGDATDTEGDAAGPEGEFREREVFFIGLGDAVMPTVMVASAAFFSRAEPLGVPGLAALNLPALTAMIGTFVGLAILLWAVMKGRAHAGLPLLNGGAIGGYLLGSVLAGIPILTALGL